MSARKFKLNSRSYIICSNIVSTANDFSLCELLNIMGKKRGGLSLYSKTNTFFQDLLTFQ